MGKLNYIIFKITLLTTFWLTAVYAKAELSMLMFDIKHIDYSDGLSSQRVFSIIEDQNSAIWMATKIGIDRYNGQIVNVNI